MRNSTIKKFNRIAFLIIPIIIVLIAVIICVLGTGLLIYPDIDDDAKLGTESGELWKVLEVVEGETSYIIYSVDSSYQFDNNHLIAFRGSSIEEIKDEIVSCYTNSLTTSYWDGKGIKFDFTVTSDFAEYLDEVEGRTYYDSKPDLKVIKANFSQVTLYDLSDYVGVERHNKSGIALGGIILYFYVAFFTVIVLGVELLVAFILKLTVFKVKKEN